MFRFKAFYAVSRWTRFLTGGAAAVVAASLPLLIESASNFQVLLVVAAAAFSASITLFGRPPHAGRA